MMAAQKMTSLPLIDRLPGVLDRRRPGLESVGAEIDQQELPVDAWIKQNNAYQFALSGGDDYEICYTLPAEHWPRVVLWNQQHADCRLTQIGEITESGYTLVQGEQSVDLHNWHGYQHFD